MTPATHLKYLRRSGQPIPPALRAEANADIQRKRREKVRAIWRAQSHPCHACEQRRVDLSHSYGCPVTQHEITQHDINRQQVAIIRAWLMTPTSKE